MPSTTPPVIRSLDRHPARLIQRAFEQSHVGIVLTDGEGRILLANAAFQRLTGHTQPQLTGQPIERFFICVNSPRSLAPRATRSAAFAWQQEVLCLRGDSATQPILMSVDALHDAPSDHPPSYLRTFTRLVAPEDDPSGPSHWMHLDPVTRLPNWLLLRDRLGHALTQAERQERRLTVMLIDIDRFQAANAAVGQQAGDRLLSELAMRLRGTLRNQDTLARLGGDQFVVILEQQEAAEAAQHVAERLQEALEPPFIVGAHQLLLTASIGVAIYPDDATQSDALLGMAREAMHDARRRGAGQLAFVDRRLTARLKRRVRLYGQLSEAAQQPEHHFSLRYQPELDPLTGRCLGLNARIYWHPPRRTPMAQADIQEALTQLGLSHRLERWALEALIADRRHWQATGALPGTLPVTLMVSARHLASDEQGGPPLDHLLRRQQDTQPWLTLSVASHELAAMRPAPGASHRLKRLRALGVTFAIEGVEASSIDLAALTQLPLSQARLRLTASAAQATGPDRPSLALSLCRLLDSLDMTRVLTDIDSAKDAAALAELPVARVLGNHYCPPLAPTALDAWLAERPSA